MLMQSINHLKLHSLEKNYFKWKWIYNCNGICKDWSLQYQSVMSGVKYSAHRRQRWPKSPLSVAIKHIIIKWLIASTIGTRYSSDVILRFEVRCVGQLRAQCLEFVYVEVGAADQNQVDERNGESGVEHSQTCVALIALFRLDGTFICQKHNI